MYGGSDHTYTYIHIHTQGRFNNHIAHSLYRIMVTVPSVVGVMEMRNILPTLGIEPTSLALWISVFNHYTI